MKRILIFLLMILSGSCFSGSKRKPIYKGKYKEKTFEVAAVTRHNFNGSRTDYSIRLGGLPAVPVVVIGRFATPVSPEEVTTDWGRPYSDSVFGAHPRVYFANSETCTSDFDTSGIQHECSMLYLSPARFSMADFEAYAAFLKEKIGEIDAAVAHGKENHFPHLIGLVYSHKEALIQRFRGRKNGAAYVLRIDPDGYVNLLLDDGSADQNHTRHAQVQMPGRVIALHTLYLFPDYHLSREEVLGFRNRAGKGPGDYFRVEE